MRELQPINQNVLLQLEDEAKEMKTASGLIIPDSVKVKKNIAKVLSMSAIDNAEIKVGDMVMYKEFAGTETELDGHKYLLIPYSEILAVVVETEAI